MMKPLYILFISVVIAFLSCNRNQKVSEMQRILDRIDSAEYSNPDSTSALLDSVGMIVEWAQHADNSLLEAQGEYARGVIYTNINEDAKAIKSLMRAAEIAKGIDNPSLKYKIYTKWGWIIRAEIPYSESIEKYKTAKKYAIELNDTAKILNASDMEAWGLIYQGKNDEAKKLFDRDLTIAKSYGKNYQIGKIHKGMAVACWQESDFKSALQHINRAITLMQSDEDKSLMAVKGRIFADLGQFDSAHYYIEKGKSTDHFYQLATYYADKADVEEMQKKLSSALEYRHKYEAYLDSTYNEDKRNDLMKMQKLYDYSSLLAQRNSLQEDSHRKSIVVIVLAFLCVSGAMLAWIIYGRMRKRANMTIEAKQLLINQSMQMVKDKNYELMQMRQQAHDQELELMENLSSKEEEMARLRQKQRILRDKIFAMDEVIRKIESLKEMNEAKKIRSASDVALTDKELDDLLNSVNICYDSFIDRLRAKFPELTSADLYLCSLLKMRVNSQNIGLLLQINDATLRKRKYRLKNKKMLVGDDFESLDDFLEQF